MESRSLRSEPSSRSIACREDGEGALPMTDNATDPASEAGRFDSADRGWGVPRATIILVEVAAFVIIAIGMAAIPAILAPVVLALILTICVHPVRSWLIRKGISRGIATGSVIIVVFALLAGFI